MKLGERIKQFLAGRYGSDTLNNTLIVSAAVLLIASAILGRFDNTACFIISVVMNVVSIGALGFSCFRMFSRDLSARHKENEKFIEKVVAPFRSKKNELSARRSQKATHKFFKCPNCRQTVRVPKGKGKVRITCPKCGETFIKET